MHIILEPAEVAACEISLELYTDIFCGRYEGLEWHSYQSSNSDSYKEVMLNSGIRRKLLMVMRDLIFREFSSQGDDVVYNVEQPEVDEHAKASRDMYCAIKARNKICRNLEVSPDTKADEKGKTLSNYPSIVCSCGEEIYHNRCMIIELEKKNCDVLLDAAAITMLVYDWKIGEVFELITGDSVVRDIAKIIEALYPKVEHRLESYKEAKRLYDKLQEAYNKEYKKEAI